MLPTDLEKIDTPRRMPPRLILTLAVAAAIAIAAFVVAAPPRPGAGREFFVVLPSAIGLRQGASVTYLGLDVGVVRRIELVDRHIVVAFTVRRPDVDVRASDSVRLRTLGLLGDKVIDITPGPVGAPPARAGDTLRAAIQ
jgi:phospholipid/cholesterol/gamma-HCH transport system substrate-binding protein